MGLSFTTENIKAIIRGDKTQTRRLIKEGEHFVPIIYVWERFVHTPTSVYTCLGKDDNGVNKYRLKYQVGRKYKLVAGRTLPQVYYRFNDDEIELAHIHRMPHLEHRKELTQLSFARMSGRWHYGWRDYLDACGYQTLSYRITGLRSESLQDITEVDAIAEGVKKEVWLTQVMYWDYQESEMMGFNPTRSAIPNTAIGSYRTQWDSFHAKEGKGWETNPIVRVIEFEGVKDD